MSMKPAWAFVEPGIPGGPNHEQWIYGPFSANGLGASVIRGPYSYGGERGLYELAIIEFQEFPTDRSPGRWRTREDLYVAGRETPVGYLTSAEVQTYLELISKIAVRLDGPIPPKPKYQAPGIPKRFIEIEKEET